jgi:putative nucleotidyltransferase with HDIG domain
VVDFVKKNRIFYRTSQFFSAIFSKPDKDQMHRVKEVLDPDQLELFIKLQSSEQMHAIQTMTEVEALGFTNSEYLKAALLHDIGKTSCLNSDKDHAEIGKKICIQNSLDEIADIVGQHVRLRNYNLNESCSETEIVYYSDKRVNHNKIVPLRERLSYILARYGNNQKQIVHAIKMNFDLCKEVEKKLFRKLKFDPESVPYLARDENMEI